MRVIRVSRRRLSRAALKAAAAVIRGGGVVAFPTETAYGLAADPTSAGAIQKIFRIKGRGAAKQLPLIAASFRAAVAWARFAAPARRLAARHWPGPLTLVIPVRAAARLAVVTRKDATLAVRMPAAAPARALAAAAGGLITSTSANLTGRQALYSGAAVRHEFRRRRHQPDLLLDAGRLPRRPPSTIVRFERGRPVVVRQGDIVIKLK